MHAFRIGRIGGIELRVDPSWLIIFLLLTWSLGTMFGSWHPQWGLTLSVMLGALAALLFFASVLLHEISHCVVALAYGIPVRDITLHLFGGLANIEEEPPSPKAEFWMAIVGPATSFLIAFAASTAGTMLFMLDAGGDVSVRALESYRQFGPATTLLLWLGTANLIVALFNMLPGLPLDGGRVLRATLWAATGNVRKATRWSAIIGQLIGWLLVFSGILMAFGTKIPLLGQGFGPGVWTALIGWFLRGAAVQAFQSAVLQDLLEGARAGDVMRRRGAWIHASATLRSVIDDVFLGREDQAVPVFDGPTLVGMLSVDDVRRVSSETRDRALVRSAMTPLEKVTAGSATMPLFEALRIIQKKGGAPLPLVDAGRLVGMLHESDIARWIDLHATTDIRGTGHATRTA